MDNKNRTIKPQVIGILIIGFFVLNKSAVFSQNIALKPDTISETKIGIRIPQKKFDSLVEKYNHLMQRQDSITRIDDYITLARLFNTIYYSDLNPIYYGDSNRQPYKDFIYYYTQFNYSMAVIKNLKAILQKGQWFNCPKYDLHLGGPATDKSQFMIVPK